MRGTRLATMAVLLGTAVLGAWLGVVAQDRHTSWPPPPIVPPEEPTAAEVHSGAEDQSVDHLPPSAAPGESGVIRADYTNSGDPEPIMRVSARGPQKMPAEVPAQATKLPATGLVDTPPPLASPELTPRPPLPAIVTPDTHRSSPEVLKQAPTKIRASSQPAAPMPETPASIPVPPVVDVPVPAASPGAVPSPPSRMPSGPTAPLPPLPELITVPAPAAPAAPTTAPPPPALVAPPPAAPASPAAPKFEPQAVPPASIQRPAPIVSGVPMTPAPAKSFGAPPPPPEPQRPPSFLLVKPRRMPGAASSGAQVPAMPTSVAPRETTSPALPTPLAPLATPGLPGDRVLASSASLIKVEKRGPATLKQGMNASFQIVVRNYGSQPSGPVRIEDELPRAARLRGGEPQPVQAGDKVVWDLDNLEAGAEKVLLLDLLATGSGEFVSRTTVFVSAATTTSKTRITESPVAASTDGVLGIEVINPPTANVGQEVLFEVTATNRGKQWLTELVLYVKVDDGLRHPAGAEIEADVGNLEPGVTKTFRVPLTAVRVGRQQISAKIRAAGGIEAAARAAVNVAAPGLSVRLPASTKLWLDRQTDLRIDIGNQSAKSTRNVTVSSTLPEHVDFVAASDRGIYQAGARTVQWLLDAVPPWETRSVSVRVQPRKPGELAQEVVARAQAVPEARAQSILQVEAHSNLKVIVTPRDNPLEVGRDTIYEVRVQNHGNAPATNVQLKLTMPLGLTPGFAQGPTGHRSANRIVTFDPLAKLPPRTQAVYHLGATAQAEGDWRVRVQVRSDQDRQPLVREVATMAYRE